VLLAHAAWVAAGKKRTAVDFATIFRSQNFAVCRDRVSFFSRRQAPRVYNSACHKLKLGIAEGMGAIIFSGQNSVNQNLAPETPWAAPGIEAESPQSGPGAGRGLAAKSPVFCEAKKAPQKK
jgi:hypothetical protein